MIKLSKTDGAYAEYGRQIVSMANRKLKISYSQGCPEKVLWRISVTSVSQTQQHSTVEHARERAAQSLLADGQTNESKQGQAR